MRTGDAVAEDLRRLGLILLAAGIVSGFLQDEIGPDVAVYTVVGGLVASGVGYCLHRVERKREQRSGGT